MLGDTDFQLLQLVDLTIYQHVAVFTLVYNFANYFM